MYDKLKQELQKRGMSVHALARRANIAPPDLYTVLSGGKRFYPGWQLRVAQALDMSVADLFGDARQSEPRYVGDITKEVIGDLNVIGDVNEGSRHDER